MFCVSVCYVKKGKFYRSLILKTQDNGKSKNQIIEFMGNVCRN